MNWRPIPNFEGYYEASICGKIRSVDRMIIRRDGRKFKLKGKILAGSRGKRRHRLVILRKDYKSYPRYVHQLVAETFIGPRPKGRQVRHGPNGVEAWLRDQLDLDKGG